LGPAAPCFQACFPGPRTSQPRRAHSISWPFSSARSAYSLQGIANGPQGAEALFLGKPPFADIGGAQIREIVSFSNFLFVCRPDFKARHAYLIAQALAQHPEALPARAGAPEGAVPAHPTSPNNRGGFARARERSRSTGVFLTAKMRSAHAEHHRTGHGQRCALHSTTRSRRARSKPTSRGER
jgi:hypothetical protein